ncbi:hypothetical protein, partial [Pseudomonas floridensis]|uniref:hypothetical protein n=1 Tax=Pseudomonas floridensis TaxID=1958950 RepID=UPI0039E829C6
DFFDFAVGAHHGWQAPERNREHSIGLQLVAWNVGFVERIRLFGRWGLWIAYGHLQWRAGVEVVKRVFGFVFALR